MTKYEELVKALDTLLDNKAEIRLEYRGAPELCDGIFRTSVQNGEDVIKRILELAQDLTRTGT